MRRKIIYSLAFAGTAALLQNCGQGPSFTESGNVPAMASEKKGNAGSETTPDGNATAANDPAANGEGDVPITIDEHGNVVKKPSGGTTTGTPGGSTETPASKSIEAGPGQVYKIPADVSDDDAAALQNCLVKWKDNLPARFAYYHKIAAQVSVMGYGTAINDTFRTDAPSLTLVAAAVNVMGTPVYNFLNPNGYYCIKVGVNVMTNLTVNLNCAAHLADSKVDVNVGSTVGTSTAVVGVAVMSTITVKDERQAGDQCIR